MNLAEKKCTPCDGGTSPFTQTEIDEYLPQAPLWSLAEDIKSISRDFTYKNFTEALAFVNKVGELAEAEGHHPDIFLHDYKKVRLTLSTHAIGGLSENDFILAAKADKLA